MDDVYKKIDIDNYDYYEKLRKYYTYYDDFKYDNIGIHTPYYSFCFKPVKYKDITNKSIPTLYCVNVNTPDFEVVDDILYANFELLSYALKNKETIIVLIHKNYSMYFFNYYVHDIEFTKKQVDINKFKRVLKINDTYFLYKNYYFKVFEIEEQGKKKNELPEYYFCRLVFPTKKLDEVYFINESIF